MIRFVKLGPMFRVGKRMVKTLPPFPVSTSIQQMIDDSSNKPTIRYMTDEEVMNYLISTHNDKPISPDSL